MAPLVGRGYSDIEAWESCNHTARPRWLLMVLIHDARRGRSGEINF